jgi:hypothetical protein
MWRCASSLELLPAGVKTDLGETLLKKAKTKEMTPSDLWCLSRLGARKLFHGPNNAVLPAVTVSRWVDALLKVEGSADALVAMARVTGDGARDLSASTVELVRRALKDGADRLDSAEQNLDRVFGEELPSGLVVAGLDEEAPAAAAGEQPNGTE